MPEPQGSRCIYHLLENGVHEFTLLEFSPAGVDAFVDAMHQMDATLVPGQRAPVLLDSSRGTQPLRYSLLRFRQSPLRHWQQSSGLAILLKPGVMANVTASSMSIFPRLNVRCFRSDERQAALDWLQKR